MVGGFESSDLNNPSKHANPEIAYHNHYHTRSPAHCFIYKYQPSVLLKMSTTRNRDELIAQHVKTSPKFPGWICDSSS
ncbi:hypothetical protein BDQ17DRAFT_1356832 [Cyathus striatus]|nr:hypothetical protein BDQ17DRAFT_1356832 [Cyathus striatus]